MVQRSVEPIDGVGRFEPAQSAHYLRIFAQWSLALEKMERHRSEANLEKCRRGHDDSSRRPLFTEMASQYNRNHVALVWSPTDSRRSTLVGHGGDPKGLGIPFDHLYLYLDLFYFPVLFLLADSLHDGQENTGTDQRFLHVTSIRRRTQQWQ